MANTSKNNFSELQKDFLITIIKNSNYKIQMLDIQYKNMLIKVKNEIKNDYIKELEKQIEYRDEVIKEFKINIQNSKCSTLIKELDNLKSEYKSKIEKAYISQNIPLFQLSNMNNPIPYNNSLTNPNNIDQVYSTITGTSKRSGTQSKKKNKNKHIIKSLKKKISIHKHDRSTSRRKSNRM